jgi:hypothetical protein
LAAKGFRSVRPNLQDKRSPTPVSLVAGVQCLFTPQLFPSQHGCLLFHVSCLLSLPGLFLQQEMEMETPLVSGLRLK